MLPVVPPGMPLGKSPFGAGASVSTPAKKRPVMIASCAFARLAHHLARAFSPREPSVIHPEPDWLDEMAAEVRSSVEPGRHVHLVLEHDGNEASHLRRDFTAQWNDDFHHVLHVIATSERDGYYEDYVADPLAQLLNAGVAFQRGLVPPHSVQVKLVFSLAMRLPTIAGQGFSLGQQLGEAFRII